MTNRWINWVLAAVVSVGMVAAALHQRPRLAQERAEFLAQDVVTLDDLGSALPDRVVAPPDPSPSPSPSPSPTPPSEPTAVASSPVVTASPTPSAPPFRLGDHGVTAGEPLAVEVGMQVLADGGNAVDAAIAMAYALGVAEPFGSGIGGGGSMLVVRHDGQVDAYDYRETAPSSGAIPSSNIGVPGFVAGMEAIHADHATMPLPELIEPAVRIAEDGFVVGEYLRERLLAATYRMPTHRIPTFFPGGSTVEVGDVVRQPDYAAALRLLQDQGADAFYRGPIGQLITDAVSGLEMADFEAYEVLELEPSVGTFGDWEVLGVPAPLAGPVVIQMLQVAEELGINEMDLATDEAYHAIAQSWRAAMNQRVAFLGDPTQVEMDQEGFTSRERARELAASIPPDGFIDVSEWEDPLTTESDTTHTVVVDDEGTMVSFTNTLSNFFGSGLMVSGFFLNDQLKNFSRDPASVNAVAPGKRPRSFAAPMVVRRDGKPVMGLGSPGGRRIPSMVSQVLIRWAGHGEPLADAVRAPRLHLEDTTLHVEASPPGGVVEALTERGYEVTVEMPTTEFYGAMQTLVIDYEAGRVYGADDGRREGAWDALSREEAPPG